MLKHPIFKYGKMMKTLLTVALVLAPALALSLAGQGQSEGLSCTGRGHRIMSEYSALYDAAMVAAPSIRDTRQQMSIALLRGARYEDYDRPTVLQGRIDALSSRLAAQEDAILGRTYPRAMDIVSMCRGEGPSTCTGFGGLSKTQHAICDQAALLAASLTPRRAELLDWPASFGGRQRPLLQSHVFNPVDYLLTLERQNDTNLQPGYISAGFLFARGG